MEGTGELVCPFCLESSGVLHRAGCKCTGAHYHLECVQHWCKAKKTGLVYSEDGFVLCTVCKAEQKNFRAARPTWIPYWWYTHARRLKPSFEFMLRPLMAGKCTLEE